MHLEKKRNNQAVQRGLSLIELMVALAVISVVAAMAIPSLIRIQKNARLSGDAHSLTSVLSVAKMRAAADFTESRVFLFTGTDKTQYFRIDVWNKTAGSGGTSGCWVPDAVTNPGTNGANCITNSAFKGSENFLSTGVSAGYGSTTTSPDTNVTFQQASSCWQGSTSATSQGSGGAISNTACIQFNSRGFPTTTTGSSAGAGLYITDGSRVYCTMANVMGLVHTYVTSDNGTTWKAQ